MRLVKVGVGRRSVYFCEVVHVARWIGNMWGPLEPTHDRIFVSLKAKHEIQKCHFLRRLCDVSS